MYFAKTGFSVFFTQKIILVIFFFAFYSVSLAQVKVLIQPTDMVQVSKQNEGKILSGKLIERLSEKLYSAKLGKLSADNLKEPVVLYFSNYPTGAEISELNNLGIICHVETWTPPLPNHPYGFIIAELPITQLDNTINLNFVKKIGTAAQLAHPQNNEAARKIKADSVWLKGYTGNGIKVGVLDSGLDTQPANSDLPSVIEKRDYSNYPTSIDTTVENTVTGHGTHVVGSILGRGVLSSLNTGNGGGAFKGMAPNASLTFLKIGTDADGSATSAAMIGAMHAAIDTFHVKVLSMSFGGWYEHHDGSSADEQAVDWVYSQGVPFFLSAGNDGDASRH
jgi:subtilisin family serine protease